MTTRILIIDEDPHALQSYREALAPKAGQWQIEYAASSEEALKSAHSQKPNIVIASLSIADGHGAELLAQFEKVAPDAQRFITATQSEKPKLEETFGSSFQYLPSPCPAPRLITEIQRCFAIDNWLGNPRVKQLVAKMGEFPSLPPIYLKVVNALNSRHADTSTIAQAISGDLAISAKVLQTVNSSFYGFDEKIANISEAINILGTDCVKNLVLAIQVFNSIGHSKEHKAITDELWHHSMSVAVAARRLAAYETKNDKIAEEAYTAGLMHDIGKLILLNADPAGTAEARKLASEKSIPLAEAEDQVIGCNHAETGAYVLARWGMPANLTEAVALHHEPVNSFGKSFSALAAVHVANAIVHHRQKPDHPSATLSEAFLVEIGKSDSWETWLAVTSGKTPPAAQKGGLALKKPDSATAPSSPSEPQQASSGAPAASSSKSHTANSSDTPQAQDSSAPLESRKSKVPLIAIAACALFSAAGIYTLNTIDTVDSATEPELANEETGATTSLVSNMERAKELSGLAQTEEALQEIFDAETEEVAPIAAEETPVPEETSEIASREAQEAPQPSLAPEQLPKPQLPDVKDSFPNIELAGIFYNAERPLASVNGKIRRVGDSVSGAQIVRIDKHQVVLKYENTLRAFKLN
ncbi:HDOD domain-containing protein [Pelagicoccus sp. NFK12]|uniref:HDOD domain-containing protein n=1 Tax=Pelagicoccus enzymogenes TaxID=2773457 RepID=A0A927IG84_9BACT|nr:HDOD domain-containing protein [Pelagicoccus enzymogenes]MBD5778529.1 HDOD domain-containing protein [Pelagicoccus enzymogenes]